MIILRPDQDASIQSLAKSIASGKRKIIYQLSTGGGKTVTFSAIAKRYTEKSGKACLILVNRTELLKQARKTLWKGFSTSSQVIVAGMKSIPKADIYIGMVESVFKRKQKLDENIGMVIIDEAHIAAFNKLHDLFPEQIIIGFTATPLSASRKRPMNMFYEDIVCGVDISELIKLGHLSQNITYAPRDVVERAALTIRAGEFDDKVMAEAFSKPRYITNTVNAYEKWALGTKTIIFNVNIEHSKAVCDAFKLANYNVMHLDGSMNKAQRDYILNWFKHTPDAILCNVGIATTGFDEPTIETVIMNKATKSEPLWLQCCGRGSRRIGDKNTFTIIDMGGNALDHGDWCDVRNWEHTFRHPPKPSKNKGVPSVKSCDKCDAIISASAKTCKICGYEMPEKPKAEEGVMSEFVIITKGINVEEVMQQNKDRKAYYTFFSIGKQLVYEAKRTIPFMNDEIAKSIHDIYIEKVREWRNLNGKRINEWHKEKAAEHIYTELADKFKKWGKNSKLVPVPPTTPTTHIEKITPLSSIKPLSLI